MNKLNLLSKLAITGVVSSIGMIGIQSSILAQNADFFNEGYSIFAAPDPLPVDDPNVDPTTPGPDANSQQCAECDSTVSFSVYDNTDLGNWTTELGLPAVPLMPFSSVVDTNAPYVFFYEVVNTDPLPQLEDTLVNFNVAVETKPPIGSWFGPSPYSSGGYIPGYVFTNASRDINDNFGPTDPVGGIRVDQDPDLNCVNNSSLLGQIDRIPGCPANWTPDVLVDLNIGLGPGVNPTQLSYGQLANNEIARLRPEVEPTNGMRFLFGNPIPVDPDGTGPLPTGNSSLLFLTAHTEEEFMTILEQNPVPGVDPEEVWLNVKSYPWSETQSQGGEGSKGDVPGVKIDLTKKTPEPGTILGLLAVSGLGLGLRRKKQ